MKTSDRLRAAPPERERMAAATRRLHEAVDASIRRHRSAFLHPDGESTQHDLFGSQTMIDWQEEKARRSFLADACWSDLPAVYSRYGSSSSRRLIDRVRELEAAPAVVLTDSGMQAAALLFDVLMEPGAEAVVARGSYNKTKAYLKRLTERLGGRVRLVDDASVEAVEAALTGRTRIVFVETYSNPLTRAADVPRLAGVVERARERAPGLRLVVDNTVATPWGTKAPLVSMGADFVVASGTKALDGRDRNMWGYVASARTRDMNDVMDVQAMRGGTLDWRRAEAIASGLDEARDRFALRSCTAASIAAHLAEHPRVSEVFHPSLPGHPDADIVRRDYRLHGSLVSFRLRDAGEAETRRFCDVLAMTGVPRYALSFDGLVTKVNHHRSVSEHFATDEEARALGVDRLVRLAVGVEAAEDLVLCLDWALASHEEIPEEQVARWQRSRRRELGIDEEGEDEP